MPLFVQKCRNNIVYAMNFSCLVTSSARDRPFRRTPLFCKVPFVSLPYAFRLCRKWLNMFCCVPEGAAAVSAFPRDPELEDADAGMPFTVRTVSEQYAWSFCFVVARLLQLVSLELRVIRYLTCKRREQELMD